jgi:hypothetical protein
MNSSALDSPADKNVALKPGRAEINIVAGIIFVVILLTTVPYLLAYSVSSTFVGQIYNIVDFSVYMSWTRQAADGHFGTLNLFTTVKQHGYLFNVLFLVMGNVVRVTGLPIPIVFQIFRIGGAVVLLLVAYLLCRTVYPESINARLTAFALIALSSGFGFTYWPKWANINYPNMPVDTWQPEAFTFLSIYTTVLFVVATTFILTAFYNLIRGELTGNYKYAVYAGLCGLALGNIHSYDVLHIAAAWGFYLVAATVIEKKFNRDRWLRAFLAGALTLPSTVYQFWVFLHEPVFHARANTPTLSPILLYYVLGYGFVFFLALAAVILIATKRQAFIDFFSNKQVMLWIASWAVAGLTIIYLPVQFQRKMAMGEHVPLCILAGGAAAYIATGVRQKLRPILLSLLVVATFPTNALFLARDYHHIEYNTSEIQQAEPFLTDPQVDVLKWLRRNTKPGQAVLAFPPMGAIGQFVPGYCDRPVWVGHWSETPNYAQKSAELLEMCYQSTPENVRHLFIVSTGVRYLVYPTSTAEEPIYTREGPMYLADLGSQTPAYLTPLYRTEPAIQNVQDALAGSYTIFRVNR